MRKLDKIIIWPLYFDSEKGRKDGRRVPKNLAAPSPKITEIQAAADRLGLKNEVNFEVRHPRFPWVKTGFLLVEKKGSKAKTIQSIAEQLLKIKSETAK